MVASCSVVVNIVRVSRLRPNLSLDTYVLWKSPVELCTTVSSCDRRSIWHSSRAALIKRGSRDTKVCEIKYRITVVVIMKPGV